MKNRNINTLLNAFSALILTLINGLLGIVVTRLIIGYYGSDFNGLNSTANQIINVLLVIEGGFTLASNVVLFSPYGENNYALVNNILYVTRKKFHVIGFIFSAVGLLVSILYSFLINSELPQFLVFSVIIMAVIPSAFNLFFATTYRVLLQTMQKEYIINFTNVITIGFGHICTIVLILFGGSVWLVRVVTMLFGILNSLLLIIYVKKTCPFLQIRNNNYEVIIPGTRDVMIQKITGIIYSAAPIVFLSISPSGGTILASIYAVYNNVFNMVKSLLRSLIDAPRLSIGQMLSENEKDLIWPVFYLYEFVAILAVFVACVTAYVLVLPFISVYTRGIADANYYDGVIALMMVLIAVFEIIHIPSGHLINMAGKFKISMYFQAIACIILVLSMTLGVIFWGIYGLMASVLIVAILLAVLEIGYVHMVFFRNHIVDFFKMITPYYVVGVVLCILEKRLSLQIQGYFQFFVMACILACVNCLFALLIGIICNKQLILGAINRISYIFKRVRG